MRYKVISPEMAIKRSLETSGRKDKTMEGRIVTIPNLNVETMVGHSMIAVKVTYYTNGLGSCKGIDKYGRLHWFTADDISKVK